MRIEIDTSLTQLFAGTHLPTGSTCTYCDHRFDADDRCILHAIRPEDASTYTLEGLSCPDCAPETIVPTSECSEHLLTAHLTTTTHSSDEALILSNVHAIQTSPPSEGSTTEDPIALVPTAELPELSHTTYHIECDDEQRTPLCNCSPNSEYTRITFGDLEADNVHCCQTCLTVYRNGHETHPSLIQGPHHAQIETADPPNDVVSTTTQRATSPITPTSVQAQTHSQE